MTETRPLLHFTKLRYYNLTDTILEETSDSNVSDLSYKNTEETMTSAFTEIPVIDFGPFINGTLEEKTQVAEEIGSACRQVGFFYLKNYGIPPEVTENAFDQVRRYFSLPLEEKMASVVGEVGTETRGYSSMFEQKLDEKTADRKESFHIGFELSANDEYRVKHGLLCYGPNIWPKNLPVLQLAHRVLQAFALALHLPEDYFASFLIEKPMVEFSVYYYPPQPKVDDSNQI
ncbi:unnamed protein product, partial [Didymodactylos carnosus]